MAMGIIAKGSTLDIVKSLVRDFHSLSNGIVVPVGYNITSTYVV